MKPAKSKKRFLCIRLLEQPHRVDGEPNEADRIAAREALQKLAAWCEQFSPVVAADESETCDTLLLEVTGLARLFGGEGALARQITRKFRRRGLAVQVAVADTLGGAWALAHFARPLSGGRRRRAVADLPTESPASTAGLPQVSGISSKTKRRWTVPFVIPPGQMVAVLNALPVAALRLPAETTELLTGLGLHTIAQVAALPRDQLSARFGAMLLKRIDQVTGARSEVIEAQHPLAEVTAEYHLEYATDRRDSIRRILELLLRQVCQQLAQRGQGALKVACRLNVQSGDPIWLSLGLYRPSAQPRHLIGLADLQLERVALREPITGVQTIATLTAPLEVRQQELFAAEKGDRPEWH
jgi:protein ImuB